MTDSRLPGHEALSNIFPVPLVVATRNARQHVEFTLLLAEQTDLLPCCCRKRMWISHFTPCNSYCQASEVGRASAAGMRETSERRGYHFVQANRDARVLLVSGSGTQTCWAPLARATSWSERVWTTNIAWSSWRCSAMQTMLGDLGTRKSRSGMAVMWRSHLIKHGTAVKSTTALSSGESECHALLRSSALPVPTRPQGARMMLASQRCHPSGTSPRNLHRISRRRCFRTISLHEWDLRHEVVTVKEPSTISFHVHKQRRIAETLDETTLFQDLRVMRLPISTGVQSAIHALSQQANIFQIVPVLTCEPLVLIIWEFHKHFIALVLYGSAHG